MEIFANCKKKKKMLLWFMQDIYFLRLSVLKCFVITYSSLTKKPVLLFSLKHNFFPNFNKFTKQASLQFQVARHAVQ